MELTDRLKEILNFDFYMMSRLPKVNSSCRVSALKFGKPVLFSGMIWPNHLQVARTRTLPHIGW